ncbi:MAG: GNAT family N-acetyltransferase, partial [Rubrobacteraceae bacterium]
VEAVYESAAMALATEPEERERVMSRDEEEVADRHERYRAFLRSDPGGAWVADDGGAIVGGAIALKREKLWVLSLFAVEESRRGKGVGRELLDHALSRGEGCEAGMIASSTHPAAMRSYAVAGFTLHPTLTAEGFVRREQIPTTLPIREGESADLALAAGLSLKPDGPICVKGKPGPLFPYLPSEPYL